MKVKNDIEIVQLPDLNGEYPTIEIMTEVGINIVLRGSTLSADNEKQIEEIKNFLTDTLSLYITDTKGFIAKYRSLEIKAISEDDSGDVIDIENNTDTYLYCLIHRKIYDTFTFQNIGVEFVDAAGYNRIFLFNEPNIWDNINQYGIPEKLENSDFTKKPYLTI